MQILNISVMNRPSKSITSKPYATEFTESTGMYVGFDVRQDNYHISESSAYVMGIMDCMVRNNVVELHADIEQSSYSMGVQDVQITRGTSVQAIKLDTESTGYTVGVTDVQVTRTVKYIDLNIDTESSSYSVGVSDVQITK